MAEVQQMKPAVDVEKEQEALLMAKYGGMKPKKKPMPKEHKYFDSADWALQKEAQIKEGEAISAEEEQLPPKLEPTTVPPRRVSKLEEAHS